MSNVSPNSQTTKTGSIQPECEGGKYLTFFLGDEGYGLEILRVREIIKYSEITHIPRTPEHVRGVINLRGQVISVVDLRARFGLEKVEPDEQTCIIVAEIERDGQQISTGVIVDRVSEVVNIDSEFIQPAPQFGSSVQTRFILGMGRINEQVRILLNAEEVLDVAQPSKSDVPADMAQAA